MKTLNRVAPLLLCVALNLLAQVPTIPIAAPPGSVSADIATVVGWVIFVFGVIAVVLIIAGFWALTHSHGGMALGAFAGIIVCIVGIANAAVLTRAVYHPRG